MYAKFFMIAVLALTASTSFGANSDNWLSPGLVKPVLDSWKLTHFGRAQIEGKNVIVSLEEAFTVVKMPGDGHGFQTVLPLNPIYKRMYRLNITSEDNADLKASFPIVKKLANIEGVLMNVLMSEEQNSEHLGFKFTVISEKDHSMMVKFNRTGFGIESTQGEIRLFPILSRL